MFEKAKKILSNKRVVLLIEIAALVLTFFLISKVNMANRKETWEFDGRDIYHEYNQALEFGKGENPYKKILNYDLLVNRKFATLFPFYYYFLFLIAKISQFDFEVFLDNYRSVLYFAEIGTAVVIYLLFKREKKPILGYVAGTFTMFNRWVIQNIMDGKQDIIAILFFVISLYLLTSKKKKNIILSFLFYGISMGIKHIGVFLGPIFLLPLIKGDLNIKEYIKAVVLFLIPTVGVGLYAIIDSPTAFFYSMLFSFTREPDKVDVSFFGYRKLLVLYNIGVEKNNIFYYLLPRLPLVIFSVLNTVLLWFRKIPIYVYCLTSTFIFIAFNPVLSSQYFVWVVPFIFMPALLNNND